MKGKGYYIGERAGLLESKHIKAMGPSRWLFSWAIRRQTGISRDGWGIVLYGNDLTYDTIKSDLGAPIRTLQRWMSRLVSKGYFRTVIRPHGFKLFIAKPKKSQAGSGAADDNSSTRFPQSGTPKVADHGTPKVADHPPFRHAKSGGPLVADHSNKSKENNHIPEKVADHRSIKDLEVKSLRRKELLSPSAPVSLSGVLKQIPGPKTEQEIEQRRQFLLRQRDQILSRANAAKI